MCPLTSLVKYFGSTMTIAPSREVQSWKKGSFWWALDTFARYLEPILEKISVGWFVLFPQELNPARYEPYRPCWSPKRKPLKIWKMALIWNLSWTLEFWFYTSKIIKNNMASYKDPFPCVSCLFTVSIKSSQFSWFLGVYILDSGTAHKAHNELDSTLVGREQTSRLKSCPTWTLSTREKCPEGLRNTPFFNFEL